MKLYRAIYAAVIPAGLMSGCSVYSKYGVQSVSISPDDRSFAVAPLW